MSLQYKQEGNLNLDYIPHIAIVAISDEGGVLSSNFVHQMSPQGRGKGGVLSQILPKNFGRLYLHN